MSTPSGCIGSGLSSVSLMRYLWHIYPVPVVFIVLASSDGQLLVLAPLLMKYMSCHFKRAQIGRTWSDERTERRRDMTAMLKDVGMAMPKLEKQGLYICSKAVPFLHPSTLFLLHFFHCFFILCTSASAVHIDLLLYHMNRSHEINEEMAYAINEEMASDYTKVLVNLCSSCMRGILRQFCWPRIMHWRERNRLC